MQLYIETFNGFRQQPNMVPLRFQSRGRTAVMITSEKTFEFNSTTTQWMDDSSDELAIADSI